MANYPIGNLARSLIAVHLDRDGRVTPYVSKRTSSGMVQVVQVRDPVIIGAGEEEFTVSVDPFHWGTVAITPMSWEQAYDENVHALGLEHPYDPNELVKQGPYASGAPGATETIKFFATNSRLRWETASVSGGCIIHADHYSEVAVVLRLEAGHKGRISFTNLQFVHKTTGNALRTFESV